MIFGYLLKLVNLFSF